MFGVYAFGEDLQDGYVVAAHNGDDWTFASPCGVVSESVEGLLESGEVPFYLSRGEALEASASANADASAAASATEIAIARGV